MAAPMSDTGFVTFCNEFCSNYSNSLGDKLMNDVDIVHKLKADLETITNELKNSCKRDQLSSTSFLEFIVTCLGSSSLELEKNIQRRCELYTEIMRTLRNACAGCPSNQQILGRQTSLVPGIHQVANGCFERFETDKRFDDHDIMLLRCCVQCLGNFVSGVPQNGIQVWTHFSDAFRPLMNSGDVRVKDYTCMLIHSCISVQEPSLLTSTNDGLEVSAAVISHLHNHDSEWSLFIVEKLLGYSGFLERIWPKLESPERALILTILEGKIDADKKERPSENTAELSVPEDHIRFLCSQFIGSAHNILGLSQQTYEMEPALVMQLLDVLIQVASSPNSPLSRAVIEDSDVLKCSINMLHCIHMVGEEGGNLFSQQNKLSEATKDNPEENPAFGLKRDLIRLIANMCHKHKENQDRVRDFGGISLIMNHTNIDSRNPFITQWAILALRNLCEDNLDNQAVIGGMKLEGMADNLETLRSFGVDADLEDGKVRIRSIKKK